VSGTQESTIECPVDRGQPARAGDDSSCAFCGRHRRCVRARRSV